jgi:hypothetical protein
MVNLMTAADWRQIKHFTPKEKWGNPYRMRKELIVLMDNLRTSFHSPITIWCGFDPPSVGGHTTLTRHYVFDPERSKAGAPFFYADATDFSVAEYDYKDTVDLLLDFLKGFGVSEKVGLGIYPGYANPSIHLDFRGEKARWGWNGTRAKNGAMVYTTFEIAYARIR